MKVLSPALQTIFADLVKQVHSVTDKAGTVYRQTNNGADYLYVKYSVGRSRRDAFIGPASDKTTLERAVRIREAQANARQRRGLVRALRDNGVPTPARSLGVVLDALSDAGLFEDAVLVGTGAYVCFSPILGVILPSGTLTTQDLDLATASLAISADPDTGSMLELLKRADKTFVPVPALKQHAPSSSFRTKDGFLVDLLVPQRRRSDKNPMPPDRLKAGAVPMQHLDWLIEDPVRTIALYGTGIPVTVPQPAKFAMHKLIVAQNRKPHERLKRQKDLHQAKALIDALVETDPDFLRETADDAMGQGAKGWKQPIMRSLKELKIDVSVLA